MQHLNRRRGALSEKLAILHKCIHKLLQVMRIENEDADQSMTESTKVGYNTMRQDGKNSPHNRLFVVVMDYDPQSLCITGHPELELPVQSGKCLCVCVQWMQVFDLVYRFNHFCSW